MKFSENSTKMEKRKRRTPDENVQQYIERCYKY